MTSPHRIWFQFQGIGHTENPPDPIVTICSRLFDRDDPEDRKQAWESAREEFRRLGLDMDRWDRRKRPIKIRLIPETVPDFTPAGSTTTPP